MQGTNFIYQAAIDAAKYARQVFDRATGKVKVVGETIERKTEVTVRFGYVSTSTVNGVEKQAFHTSTHLNKALEAYITRRCDAIMEELVKELEEKGLRLAAQSREQVAAELAMIDALRASNPKYAE